VNDAIQALGMRNHYLFQSSFNRPNLSYQVKKKDGKTIDFIAQYVANRKHESGVIYCLSRKDCEQLSEKIQSKLQEKGLYNIRVSFYHADLDAEERANRHYQWSTGIISVLCATIAFGMGIDKPDVRYVIHFSLPKSITHYYQESGRAGRDGEKADCILFYTYKDKKILEMMIRKGDSSATNGNSYRVENRFNIHLQRKIDQLNTCVRYCENQFRCRRTMQLEFFGEIFDPTKCNQTCDNCKSGKVAEKRDITKEAQQILELFENVASQKNGRGTTLTQLMDLFKGSKSKSSTKFLNLGRLTGYGAGSKFKRDDLERIFHNMVFDNILEERCEESGGGFNADYIYPGQKAAQIMNSQVRFYVDFPGANKTSNTTTTTSSTKKSSKTKSNSGKKSSKKDKTDKKNMALKNGKLCADVSSPPGASNTVNPTNSKSPNTPGRSYAQVLPKQYTETLVARITKLVKMWADEEQMNGNKVFYWNIMNGATISELASYAPVSIEELSDLANLGENILKEYGERIVKNIKSYVQQENLQSYVDKARASTRKRKIEKTEEKSLNESSNRVNDGASKRNNNKRQKQNVTTSNGNGGRDMNNNAFASYKNKDDVEEFDEFDTDIDFSQIELPPEHQQTVPSANNNKSRYFS